MRVSVVVPVYNEENGIEHCLNSLANQEFDDFEIVVVDDGSTDKTFEVLSNLRSSIFNLRIYKMKHQGAGAARNLGASRAHGEVLVFVDADMTFEPGFIKNLTCPIFEKWTAGTNTSSEFVGNWDNVWARCWNYNEGISSNVRYKKNVATERVFRAIRKKDFLSVGGFDPGGYTDDYSLSSKLGFLPLVIDDAVIYHQNPEKLSEVFFHAKWVSKRSYKYGVLGIIYTFLKLNLLISFAVGVFKTVKYKEARFLVFKIVYDFGAALGVVEYFVLKRGYK